MRGLVGAATFCAVFGYIGLRTDALLGDVHARLDVLESSLAAREASVGLEAGPLVESGKARPNWRVVFKGGDDLPSGVKQREVWKEQTAKLLAGEPPTAPEARREVARTEGRRGRR